MIYCNYKIVARGMVVPNKSKLLEKLLSKPAPTSFTIRELDALMKQCGCEKFEGGRGSGIGYYHI